MGGGGDVDLIARTNYIMLESARYICTRIAVKTKTFPILTSNETIIIPILEPPRETKIAFKDQIVREIGG